jgi:hypothetical protein
MSTAKARYAGDGSGVLLPEFSDRLRQQLRALYPFQDEEDDPVWGHPADAFVGEILSTAWWAKSALHAQGHEVTTAEIRAEHKDLLKSLRAAGSKLHNLSADLNSLLKSVHVLAKKLRILSPDSARLLDLDADPLNCADQIDVFIRHVEAAVEATGDVRKAKKQVSKQMARAVELAIDAMARHVGAATEAVGKVNKAQKFQDKQYVVAVESAIRILRVLNQHQIPAAATGDSNLLYTSKAVTILKLIGDDLRLVRSELTWRNIIIKAKKYAPDLE